MDTVPGRTKTCPQALILHPCAILWKGHSHTQLSKSKLIKIKYDQGKLYLGPFVELDRFPEWSNPILREFIIVEDTGRGCFCHDRKFHGVFKGPQWLLSLPCLSESVF